jgi:hypothetical protein
MKGVPALACWLWLCLPDDLSAFVTHHRPHPAFSADRLPRLHAVEENDDHNNNNNNNNNNYHSPPDFLGELWHGFQNILPKDTATTSMSPARDHGDFWPNLHHHPKTGGGVSPLEQVGDFFLNLQKQKQPQEVFHLFPDDWSSHAFREKTIRGESPWEQLSDFLSQGFPKLEGPRPQALPLVQASVDVPALPEMAQKEQQEEEESGKEKELLVIRGGTVHAANKRQASNVDALNNLDIRTMLSPSLLDTSFLQSNKKKSKGQEEPAAQQQEEEAKGSFAGLRARFWGLPQKQHARTTNGRVGQEIFHHKGGKRRSRSSSRRTMAFMTTSDHGGDTMVHQQDSGRDVTVTIPEHPTGPGIIKGAGKVLNGSAVDGVPKKEKASRYNIDDMEETPFYTAYGRIPRPVAARSKRISTAPPEASPYGDVRNGWFWSTKKKQVQRPLDKEVEDTEAITGIAEPSPQEEPAKVDIDDIAAMTTTAAPIVMTTTVDVLTTETSPISQGDEGELLDKDHEHPWSLPAPFTAGTMIDVVSMPALDTGVATDATPALETSRHVSSGDSKEEVPKIARPSLDSPFNPLTFFRLTHKQPIALKAARPDGEVRGVSNTKVTGPLPLGMGLVRNPIAASNERNPDNDGHRPSAQSIDRNDLNDVRLLNKAKPFLNNRSQPRPATSVTQFRYPRPPHYPRNLPRMDVTKSSATTAAISKPESPHNNSIVGHNHSNNKSFLDEIRRGKELLKADYQLLHPSTVNPKDFNPQHFYQRANTQQREDETQLRRKTPAAASHPAVPFLETFRRITTRAKQERKQVLHPSADAAVPLGRSDLTGSSTSHDPAASVLRALSLRSAESRKSSGAAAYPSQPSSTFRPPTQLISSRRLKEQERLHDEEVARAEAERTAQAALEKAMLEEEQAHHVERQRRRRAPLKLLMKWMRKPSNA